MIRVTLYHCYSFSNSELKTTLQDLYTKIKFTEYFICSLDSDLNIYTCYLFSSHDSLINRNLLRQREKDDSIGA